MRRRLLGTLLWLVLLVPVVGAGRLLGHTLRVVAGWSPKSLLTTFGLVVAMQTSDLLTEQITNGIRPLGYGIPVWIGLVLGTLAVASGLRSPWLRHLRRRMQRRGWWLGPPDPWPTG